MEPQRGIGETQELVFFIATLANRVGDIVEDGDFGFSDTLTLLTLLKSAGAALEGIGEVPREIADLDDAERQALIDMIEEYFDIPQDYAESVIERSLVIISELYALVQLIR